MTEVPLLILRDSLTQAERQLPRDRVIRWYSCGPTVYNDAHLGHARNYIVNDVLGRVLTHLGYRWELVMNITDVDDKIVAEGRRRGRPFSEVASQYEREFWRDLDDLGVARPHRIMRVSESLPLIIRFVEDLLARGWAYESAGSVYFDNHRFIAEHPEPYLRDPTGGGEAPSEDRHLGDKRHREDFALWKAEEDPEASYPSPWGRGRPGWHVECSAMSQEALGPHLDLHTGGIDLIFPHHENELRQNVARHPESHVEHFYHVGHLHIKGKKMSKSLKNFVTIRQLLEQRSPQEVRLLFLLHEHHREMEYSEAEFKEVNSYLGTLSALISRGLGAQDPVLEPTEGRSQALEAWQQALATAQGHLARFDTRAAVLAMVGVCKLLMGHPSAALSEVAAGLQEWLQSALGLRLDADREVLAHRRYIEALVQVRESVRALAVQGRDRSLFELSDRIRDQVLPSLGVKLNDLPNGSAQWYAVAPSSKRSVSPGWPPQSPGPELAREPR